LDVTYSLASGDLKDLGWQSDRAFHAELLVFGAVDEIIRDCSHIHILSVSNTALETQSKKGRTLFKVLDVAAGEGDANFVEFRGGHGAGGVVFFFAFSDVTHIRDRGD